MPHETASDKFERVPTRADTDPPSTSARRPVITLLRPGESSTSFVSTTASIGVPEKNPCLNALSNAASRGAPPFQLELSKETPRSSMLDLIVSSFELDHHFLDAVLIPRQCRQGGVL